jgi:probable addiction module antidote protein
MALKTTRWDSAEYLRTEEERAAYLDACMEEAPDDPAFIANALGVVARSRNMSQLARDTGLTREGLYKALSKEGNPSFDTVLKVVNALGYRLALVRGKKTTRVTKRTATKRPAPKLVAKQASKRPRKRA